MLESLHRNSQKASTESSQISTYLNVIRKLGSWGSPVLLQLLRRLKRGVTLSKSLAEWSLLKPADKGFTAEPEVKGSFHHIQTMAPRLPAPWKLINHTVSEGKKHDKQLSAVKSITLCHEAS